jgi:pyruvate,orthophosphate dikinase
LDLDTSALKEITKEYKALVEKETNKQLPSKVYDQLFFAVKAVFDSWFTPRAVTYRQAHQIQDDLGTAVILQEMVFGNMGNDSGTGVMFTRDPSTGEKKLYGEYLLNAQGEELVAGIRTPEPINSLKDELPKVCDELVSTSDILERHFKDMQDVEFTVEKSKLYILQTRAGKRTPQAAAKIAFDMHKDGIISKGEALRRIQSIPLRDVILQQKDSNARVESLAKGLCASPGIATGIVVFNSDEAKKCKEKGEKAILVRPQTSPEDIQGILSAEGVLTTRGGMTSHAAIVTRSLSKPCIVGCEEIEINLKEERFYVKKESETIAVTKGEVITVDGTRGEVILGEVPKVVQRLSEYVKELLTGM